MVSLSLSLSAATWFLVFVGRSVEEREKLPGQAARERERREWNGFRGEVEEDLLAAVLVLVCGLPLRLLSLVALIASPLHTVECRGELLSFLYIIMVLSVRHKYPSLLFLSLCKNISFSPALGFLFVSSEISIQPCMQPAVMFN